MNTPRQLLLDRHRHLAERLDAIRAEELRKLHGTRAGAAQPLHRPARRRGILPGVGWRPWGWAFATAWLLAGLLHLWVLIDSRHANLALGNPVISARSPLPWRQLLEARWRLQQSLQEALVGLPLLPDSPPPPQPAEAPPLSRHHPSRKLTEPQRLLT